jgi:sigma-54 dependent transcriptional regulator, acetoin dehydrogenase operon transcriptional activator AcoR
MKPPPAESCLTRSVVAALASEAPLGARLEAVSPEAPEASPLERTERELLRGVLASLLGQRDEVKGALQRAREACPPPARAQVELCSALVMLEADASARVAGALERAEAAPGFEQEAVNRVLSQVLRAQLLLGEGAVEAALEAARAGAQLLPAEEAAGSLGAYAGVVAACVALRAHRLHEAEAFLTRLRALPGCTGLFAARAQVQWARLALCRTPPAPELARPALQEAHGRLEALGATRELGLASMEMAQVAALDGVDPPVTWLARAQPLLSSAGTHRDLHQLREGFRRFGRRNVDKLVEARLTQAMEILRERRARLRDLLGAQRDALDSSTVDPRLARDRAEALDARVDSALEAVGGTEEELIGALERTVLERERMGQLVALSQQLAGMEQREELVQAIPQLALTLVQADSAELLRAEPQGPLQPLARAGAPLKVSSDWLAQEAATALAEGTPRVLSTRGHAYRAASGAEPPSGSIAVVPLQREGAPLVLTVERRGLSKSDAEQLAVYGSLAAASLARARSTEALREAAARDAATLAAIRDGVLTLDPQGLVRTLNEAALRLLGKHRDELVGRRLAQLPGLSALAEVLAAGRPLGGDIIPLPRGEVLVRTQPYPGGTVITLQELATVERLAQRLVGATARFTFEDLVGEDPGFRTCLEQARRVASLDVPILITGESGTGKELFAQALHNASARVSAPFVAINVAAIPRELLESELFGYERGAFTGARAGGKPGKFELADRGTLLLDEMGELPQELQAKLLRVLQERVVQRLGGTRDIPIRARIVATTHRDLEQAVREGAFRLDLFHRLRVVHLRLPSLAERRGDVPLLVRHYLSRYAERTGRPLLEVAPEVIADLEAYDWPGNVRELANLVEGEAIMLPPDHSRLERTPAVVARALLARRHEAALMPPSPALLPSTSVLPFEEVERRVFQHALLQYQGNVTRASQALGVAKGTLYNKMKRYGLVPGGRGQRLD